MVLACVDITAGSCYLVNMIKLVTALVYIAAIIFLGGCNPESQPQSASHPPNIEGIRITDVSPAKPQTDLIRSIKNMSFTCYKFEIPAENFQVFEEIWPLLTDEQLFFNNQKAFAANAFVLGFGRVEIWDIIAEKLKQAGGENIVETTLLFSDDQELDFQAMTLFKPREILYIDTDFSMQRFDASPGRLELRLKAKKLHDRRGVCNFYGKIMHVPKENLLPGLPEHLKAPEFDFRVTGFAAQMSPGDFLLLSPGRYIGDSKSLTNVFFAKEGKEPKLRVYMLFCSGIVD
ncbi:MAG: hypothetical protein WCZ89_01080 [Phycisphaerae bacterium]